MGSKTCQNRPHSAKRRLTGRKVLYATFLRNSGPLMQVAVPKGRVSDSFYKIVVLKDENANKNEESTSKNRYSACLFVT